MDTVPAPIWIAATAHALQQHWRTVDPDLLEEVAGDLWNDATLPKQAAQAWLRPVVTGLLLDAS